MHHGLAGVDADDVGGVVQGARGLHSSMAAMTSSVMRTDWLKFLAAVDHPVTHRVDLLHGADHAVVLARQPTGMASEWGGMAMSIASSHLLALHLGLIGELAVDADALTRPLASTCWVSGLSS